MTFRKSMKMNPMMRLLSCEEKDFKVLLGTQTPPAPRDHANETRDRQTPEGRTSILRSMHRWNPKTTKVTVKLDKVTARFAANEHFADLLP